MGIQINGNTNNINAGIGSLSIEDLNELHIVGVATAANFKTGTSNLHSTGLNIFDLDVDGQTNLDHVSVAGVTTFSEDTKFIGALSGRDLQWDKSDNALEFLDYTSAYFGTDNNLQIYHNSSNNNSYISENGVGALLIQASDLYLNNSAGQNYVICATGGRVQLNFAGNNKLETTNTGVNITGICTATGILETTGNELKITGADPRLTFTDTNNNPDFQIWANAQKFQIYDSTNSATRIYIDSSGNIGMNTTTASDSTGNCRAYTFTRTDANGQVRIILKNQGTGFGNGAGYHQGIDGSNVFIENRSDGGYIDFATNHSASITTRLRIDSGGKLFTARTHASANTGNHPAVDIDTIANGTAGSTFATGIDFRVSGVHKKRMVVTNGSGTGGGDWIFYRDQGNNEGLRIQSNGCVTKPYHPAFCATRNGASHIQLASNPNLDIVFTSVDFDNSNSYNNSNGRFTAPVAGKYYFGVQFYCGFSVTSVRVMHASWRKNGSLSHEADLFGGIGNFGNNSMNHYHPTTNAHVMLDLAVGDYVTFNTGTNSFIGSGNTYLYATKGTRFFGHLVA